MMLETRHIVKSFGALRAVNDVSISIEKGEIVGLIGPNGSGKSTLFNTIVGIYKPDSGAIYLDGGRIDGLSPFEIFRKGLAKDFQVPRLFSGMTSMENMLVPPKNQIGEKARFAPFHWIWRTQEIELATGATAVLNALQLDKVARNLSAELSGGQMKLLELGRVLMGEPRVLLADEPTAGVAPKLAVEILERLVKLRDERNLTLFLVDHRLEMLFRYVERVLVMDRGKIIALGTSEEVTRNPIVRDAYLG